jgi:hypothetical protein
MREARNLLWFVGSFALVCVLGALSGCASPGSAVPRDVRSSYIMAPSSQAFVLWQQSHLF